MFSCPKQGSYIVSFTSELGVNIIINFVTPLLNIHSFIWQFVSFHPYLILGAYLVMKLYELGQWEIVLRRRNLKIPTEMMLDHQLVCLQFMLLCFYFSNFTRSYILRFVISLFRRGPNFTAAEKFCTNPREEFRGFYDSSREELHFNSKKESNEKYVVSSIV